MSAGGNVVSQRDENLLSGTAWSTLSKPHYSSGRRFTTPSLCQLRAIADVLLPGKEKNRFRGGDSLRHDAFLRCDGCKGVHRLVVIAPWLATAAIVDSTTTSVVGAIGRGHRKKDWSMYENLLAQIDTATRCGESLDTIDFKLIERAPLSKTEKAAVWMYAFSLQSPDEQRRLVREQLALARAA